MVARRRRQVEVNEELAARRVATRRLAVHREGVVRNDFDAWVIAPPGQHFCFFHAWLRRMEAQNPREPARAKVGVAIFTVFVEA